MDNLFRLTHHNVFRIQLQVFKLLFQFARITQKLSKFEFRLESAPADSKNEEKESSLRRFSDRFYRTLYELVLKIHMSKASNLDEYFGLVFKAILADESVPRCIAFIKRLLQMCFVNEANFTAASLLIISEILRVRNDIRIQLFDIKYNDSIQNDREDKNQNSESNVRLDQAQSDEDEEVFVDVDKVQVASKSQEAKDVKSRSA